MKSITGEQRVFPIYPVRFRFHHPIADPAAVADYGPTWFEGLPAARIWGGNSFEWMRPQEQSIESVIREVTDANFPPSIGKHPGLDGWEVSVKPPRSDTWVLQWFCHYTIDVEQDDLAVLASFERFVNRNRHVAGRCLMGADDRWRWRGEKEGDLAPCRCAGYRKAGLIRINH